MFVKLCRRDGSESLFETESVHKNLLRDGNVELLIARRGPSMALTSDTMLVINHEVSVYIMGSDGRTIDRIELEPTG